MHVTLYAALSMDGTCQSQECNSDRNHPIARRGTAAPHSRAQHSTRTGEASLSVCLSAPKNVSIISVCSCCPLRLLPALIGLADCPRVSFSQSGISQRESEDDGILLSCPAWYQALKDYFLISSIMMYNAFDLVFYIYIFWNQTLMSMWFFFFFLIIILAPFSAVCERIWTWEYKESSVFFGNCPVKQILISMWCCFSLSLFNSKLVVGGDWG